ncbi:MAG: hypothetical protein IJI66_15965 [Erysipelotrichaceae bacterium]|nr:hypothetical protein [Clostridia bacterium]MBR0420660.1 hypothetical protein [Erysipelotrichaceae bacterium]
MSNIINILKKQETIPLPFDNIVNTPDKHPIKRIPNKNGNLYLNGKTKKFVE